MGFRENRMTYLAIVIIVVAVVTLLSGAIMFQHKNKEAPVGEPLDISRWEKVDKTKAIEGGFILSGEAINYGNGRPYKLHLKNGSDGSKVWYAEFVDTGEWYKTDIEE